MTKILVVDDESDLEILIKQKFRRQIREQQYEFLFAMNGQEALDKLHEHADIDIVLSDINMPGMDGLTLLGKLNEISPIIKTIIVSAYGDMENIRGAMNKGAFDFVCKPVNFEDLELTISKLIRHVSQLRETMKAIKENNILRMYVDETVLNFMNFREFENAIVANEIIDASVVFVDICGFTRITEDEPADQVVKLLNKYFDIMANEIIKQNGYIDKFIGDALLGVFKGEYHLDRAIDTCLSIRSQMQKLPVDPGGIFFSPEVRVGIDSGEMVCGNIGSANLRRLDYTVIGDVVNTAKRLNEIAGSNQILITEPSHEKIKESFMCKKVMEVHLKNKARLVTTYEVIG